MEKKDNNGIELLKEMIFESNNDNMKELLKNVLAINIKNIEYVGIENFNSIIEYKFLLVKVNLICSNDEIIEVCLKMIKGGKIKESIFCYWNLLYEEFLDVNKKEIIPKKATITQTTTEKNNSTITLTINSMLDYSAEINLVELKNFYSKNEKIERWLENIGINDDDILFIGKKRY